MLEGKCLHTLFRAVHLRRLSTSDGCPPLAVVLTSHHYLHIWLEVAICIYIVRVSCDVCHVHECELYWSQSQHQ